MFVTFLVNTGLLMHMDGVFCCLWGIYTCLLRLIPGVYV